MQWHQEHIRGGVAAGDDDIPCRSVLVHRQCSARIANSGKAGGNPLAVQFARDRQFHAPVQPHEQLPAELALQFGHGPADGGLRGMQFRGSAAEVPVVRGGLERTQQPNWGQRGLVWHDGFSLCR